MQNINVVRQLIDKMPNRTHYEFIHFELAAQGGLHRQIRYALRQYEDNHDRLQILHAKIDLMLHDLTKCEDHLEIAIKQRITHSETKLLERQISDLNAMQSQINDWLSAHTDDEINTAIEAFDLGETSHWYEMLGRELGIELLVDNKSSNATMSKLALLPLRDYKKSVGVALKFAEMLKQTTEDAENNEAVDK